MGTTTAIGIYDNLAAGETCVAVRTTYDELACGVYVEYVLLVDKFCQTVVGALQASLDTGDKYVTHVVGDDALHLLLGLGLAAIVVAMSQSQKMMLYSTYYETVQEVMDLGEMAYPIADVKDVDELEVRETKATELWDMISDERLSSAQEEKFHGYTWERECLNLHDSDDEISRIGGLYVVRVTVRWGDRFRGHGERESYVTFWRKTE